jgi:hypothetical protein
MVIPLIPLPASEAANTAVLAISIERRKQPPVSPACDQITELIPQHRGLLEGVARPACAAQRPASKAKTRGMR